MAHCEYCKKEIRLGPVQHRCTGRDAAAKEQTEARRSAAACSAGWLPIESAPKDGSEIIVYCPPAHGLPHMASVCAYHEDAGFCVDELREPKLWIPLPNSQVHPR